MSGDSEHQTIGIVLAGNFGDVLLWSAVIQPLKKRFENSRIILIGSAATLEFLVSVFFHFPGKLISRMSPTAV